MAAQHATGQSDHTANGPDTQPQTDGPTTEPQTDGPTTEPGGESPSSDPQTEGKSLEDQVAYWKQRSRQHEGRARQNAAAARELQTMKDASKSDVEKLTESNTALTTQAAQAEQELMRYRAAVKVGVPASDVEQFASRLQGDTADDLEADAAELKKLFAVNNNGDANGEQPPARERRPDRSQGAAGKPATPADELAAFMQNLK